MTRVRCGGGELSLDYSPGPLKTELRYEAIWGELIDTEPPHDAYRNE